MGCIQSRFFLADLPDALFVLAFFFSEVRLLEATFFATVFFVRELGVVAPIAVATLSQTTPGAAATVAAAVAAALANSPARVLVPTAALFPAATTVSCALATLSQTTPGAAVAVAAAVEAALAASPARVLAPSAALFPAATIVSCALVMMLLRVIFHSPAQATLKHRTRDNQSLEEVRGLGRCDSNARCGSKRVDTRSRPHVLPRPLLSDCVAKLDWFVQLGRI